ncbi:MAG: ABC transporter substrate-binding protein [Bacteroidota bacterium]
MKTFLSALLLTTTIFLYGQGSQTEYLEAKRQFSLGNYSAAQRSFQGLTEDKNFGAYASFYYALCALKQGDQKTAYDMWKQVQLNFPQWDQQSEVSYWLGYVSFSQKKYWEAFRHIENLPTDLKEALIRNELSDLTLEDLEQAYALNQDNQYIGNYLAKAIMKQPYDERDHSRLAELSDKFEILISPEEVNLPLVKKSRYSIAAVLPFMFDSLENPQSVLRNSIIWDLYQGMSMAQRDLSSDGVNIDIAPYDTKKRGDTTQVILENGYLENADVIVGPLYGGPNKLISEYSRKNKITMVNPVSSNDAIIGDNPYSYLFKPSYQTQGRRAAEYARKNFRDNPFVCIFFETDRDSLMANEYRETIEKDSFLVVRYERLTSESGLQVQKDFMEQYEVRLDTLFGQEQIDSIGLIPGRYVKTRPLRDEDDGSIIRDSDGEEVLEYYENRFTIVDDSIGHIFLASESNLLANNMISLSEVRSDTIEIIGYEDWLDFTLVSYDQLERLGIYFISPNYMDKETKEFNDLSEDFINHIGREPGQYHLIGYELIMQVGKLLDEHGTYFQRGLIGGQTIPGIHMNGMKYGSYNDNQLVPITQLKNLRLIEPETKQTSVETDENSDE